MAPKWLPKLVTLALCSSIANSLGTDDQTGASLNYGTFLDPSSIIRPRFRYWIPDASVDLGVVAGDFALAKAVGMGGLELLGYYLYGNYPSQIEEGGPIPVDWAKYGWGTDAWKDLQDAALRASKELGLVLDFAMGPNQGAGVPADPDDEGVMWHLIPFNTSVPIGGSFNSVLPGWGSGKLVSASTGLVTRKENATWSAAPAWQSHEYNGTQQTLSASSLQDVTDRVSQEDGQLDLQFSLNVEGVEYRVFAYYETRSTYLEQASPIDLNTTVPQSPVESYLLGATSLDDTTRELIREVGNFAWEDSMKIGAGTVMWWTPGLLNAFRSQHRYDLNKYLPLIFSYNTEHNGPLASPDRFFTDGEDLGQAFINEYWGTITQLNKVYLEVLTNWSMEVLHAQFSAQVGYNLPMDMLANVPLSTYPSASRSGLTTVSTHTDSSQVPQIVRKLTPSSSPLCPLQLTHTLSPHTVAGKRIISSELGAQRNEVYSQTLPELLWDTKRSLAGNINNFIFHGFPYTGAYPNTTYPGFSTFSYRFSGMHGPRNPYWEYQRGFMDCTARTQWVAQAGTPKVDLAFWLKKSEFFDVGSAYEAHDLEGEGYSYEYLSPDNFALPDAVVRDAVFAPERQAFKTLVVRGNDSLTVDGVQYLVEYARAGLPIVFSGGVPQNLSGYNNITTTGSVRSILRGILGLENVHIVPYEGLAASLRELDILPRTRVSADRAWYTSWRKDKSANVTCVYVYNDAWDSELGNGASKGSIKFEATGVPYEYDAWTGKIKPVLAYRQSSEATTMELRLAGNQTTVIGFHHNETAPSGIRAIAFPEEVYSASLDAAGRLHVAAGNTSDSVLLSNGTTVALRTPAASIQLDQWSLIVESWAPPADLEADQTSPLLSSSAFNLTRLEPWNAISESLRSVSGRGFYSTTFSWPPTSGTADGAVLELGAISNTARAWVNGKQLPPLDPTDAKADVAEFLVVGTNVVEIVVSTTLGNALRPILGQVKSSGTLWLGPDPVEQEYGLLSNVTVVPYLTTVIAL